jgi:hypothetical protein
MEMRLVRRLASCLASHRQMQWCLDACERALGAIASASGGLRDGQANDGRSPMGELARDTWACSSWPTEGLN